MIVLSIFITLLFMQTASDFVLNFIKRMFGLHTREIKKNAADRVLQYLANTASYQGLYATVVQETLALCTLAPSDVTLVEQLTALLSHGYVIIVVITSLSIHRIIAPSAECISLLSKIPLQGPPRTVDQLISASRSLAIASMTIKQICVIIVPEAADVGITNPSGQRAFERMNELRRALPSCDASSWSHTSKTLDALMVWCADKSLTDTLSPLTERIVFNIELSKVGG